MADSQSGNESMAHVNETPTSSASPDVRRIRELVAQERLLEARELLKQALRDDQGNPELRSLQVVLAPPEVTRVDLKDQDRTEELQWIATHGKEYRGQWIAVLGDKLVAHASSLKELRAALQKLPDNGTPLIHRIR